MEINELIQTIVRCIFALATTLLLRYVIPILQQFLKKTWANIAVKAAEKMYRGSGLGEKKFEYAVNFLANLKLFKLDDNGNPPEFWRGLIEACVKEMDIAEQKISEVILTAEPEPEENNYEQI